MQPMPHQLMGYDRAITMFSPEGRLLQVEYAKKTVKQGATAIGMVCKDGVLLVTDKRIIDKLIVPEATEKIFQIDDHIAATAAGILSDARVLIERAQLKAQQHRVTYDSPVDVLSIIKDICDLKQICTQSAGLRPFGVSLLVAGVDEDGSAKLFETDPTGIFFQYKATAIGEGETEAEEILHKQYKEDMTLDEGLKLAVDVLLKSVDGDKFTAERLDVVTINTDKKHFKKLTKYEIEKLLSEIKKKK
jgi:proteasome alpha subunit